MILLGCSQALLWFVPFLWERLCWSEPLQAPTGIFSCEKRKGWFSWSPRIPEKFGLEGTVRIISLQPPGMDPQRLIQLSVIFPILEVCLEGNPGREPWGEGMRGAGGCWGPPAPPPRSFLENTFPNVLVFLRGRWGNAGQPCLQPGFPGKRRRTLIYDQKGKSKAE